MPNSMFNQLNASQARQLVDDIVRGAARQYDPTAYNEGGLRDTFAVVSVDMRRVEAQECLTPEAINRAVHLANGDPERQTLMLPRAELGQ